LYFIILLFCYFHCYITDCCQKTEIKNSLSNKDS
jgi:hypothetical protein